MPFKSTLIQIFESGIETFNQADYQKLNLLIVPYAQLISPEINLPKIQAASVHLKSFDEIIAYWGAVNEHYENRITRFEYLSIGKISTVRCFYDKINMVIDSEIHFDSYGKITKMINRLVTE